MDCSIYEIQKDMGRRKKGDIIVRSATATQSAWLERILDEGKIRYQPMVADLTETEYFKFIETISKEEYHARLQDGRIKL